MLPPLTAQGNGNVTNKALDILENSAAERFDEWPILSFAIKVMGSWLERLAMTNRQKMRKRRRKLRQVLWEIKEVIKPTKMYVPEVAEIPLPEQPAPNVVYVAPTISGTLHPAQPSIKRRSW